MTTDAEAAFADLLVELRLGGKPQSGLDAILAPPDAASAYRVAAGVRERLGWSVAGWKIAANKPEMQAALRAEEPIFGPVFEQFIHESPAALDHSKLQHPVVECEYVVRFKESLAPRGTPYSQSEVSDAIEDIHIGIEVAECRFIHDDAFPALPAILADGSGSGHLVVGPAVPNWREANIAEAQITLTVDGDARRNGNAGDAIDHPLIPATWLANRLNQDDMAIQAGDLVSTGTCSHMLLAKPGNVCIGAFTGFGAVTVEFGR
jgi:2-keto-4-pentenoate hydratase